MVVGFAQRPPVVSPESPVGCKPKGAPRRRDGPAVAVVMG